MYWILFFGYLIIALVAVMMTSNCRCGKRRKWYFASSHPDVRVFVVDAIGPTVMTVFSLVTGNFVAAIWIVWAIRGWLKVYYHEKDKIRRASKALGRVVVLDNGRLAVVKN